MGVIDDSAVDYFVLSGTIARLGKGWTTCHYGDFDAGLEAVLEGAADLFLVDCVLPTGTGIELVRRAREGGATVPMIMITGSNDEATDLEAHQAGANDYLEKRGLRADALERSIRYTLSTHRNAAKLAQANERYAAAITGSHDGIWDVDLVTGEVFLSPRCRTMLGIGAHEDGDACTESPLVRLARVVHPDDYDAVVHAARAHLMGEAELFQCEYRLTHAELGERWMYVRGVVTRDELGVALRFAGSQTDITERKLLEIAAVHHAECDPLTGLANRKRLRSHLARLRAQLVAERPETHVGLLYLDLDDFKPINDQHGHRVGDALLCHVARRIESKVRGGDLVARIGGDEFVVVLEGVSTVGQAERIGAQLREAVREPYGLDVDTVRVGVSMGVAVSVSPHDCFDDLMHRADEAMFRDKAARKRPNVVTGARKGATALREALVGGQIRAHFQPVVDLAARTLVGWEALARWETPAGVRMPAEFLGALTEQGLGRTLTQVMLAETCMFLRERPACEFGAVNVLAADLLDPEFIGDVILALESVGVAPQRLRLELVESDALTDLPTVARHMQALRSRGVRFALDDFGTGYCAPELLVDLPVASIKLDRKLVARIGSSERSVRVVRSMLGLARELELEVIAEGIETELVAEALAGEGVCMGQGYLYGRAQAPESRSAACA